MTEKWLNTCLNQLQRKLALMDSDSDTLALLNDELEDAEGALLLYLGWDTLEATLLPKVVDLAVLYYQQDRLTERGYNSRSYSEGQVSQNDSYLAPEQIQAAAEELLHGLARYRRVTC